MNILSIKDSNAFLINLLQKDEPFIISRLGNNNSILSAHYDEYNNLDLF